jgi:hypothetical protein
VEVFSLRQSIMKNEIANRNRQTKYDRQSIVSDDQYITTESSLVYFHADSHFSGYKPLPFPSPTISILKWYSPLLVYV